MPFNSYNPSSFPRTSPPILPLVAPIWADFNFKSSGTIYYGVHENDDISDHITSMIARSNSDFLDYTPTLAIIVTWFQSSLFRSYIKVCIRYRNFIKTGLYCCFCLLCAIFNWYQWQQNSSKAISNVIIKTGWIELHFCNGDTHRGILIQRASGVNELTIRSWHIEIVLCVYTLKCLCNVCAHMLQL